MPKFTYIGTNSAGESVKQTVEAADRFAVYALARTDGHTISSVEAVGAFSVSQYLNFDTINAKLSRVKGDELVMVTRNLGSMITAGLTVSRALSVILRQTKNPKLKPSDEP